MKNVVKKPNKREQLKSELDKNKVLELFVCQYSVDEIADKLGSDRRYIEQILHNSLREFFTLNQQYAERAALMNTAKLRLLTKTWLPKALDGNYNAAMLILKIIKLEEETIQGLTPAEQGSETVEYVQKFEQTMTSTDPRYAIALGNLNKQTDDESIFSLPSIEKLDDIPELTDDSMSDIQDLMQKHTDLLKKLDLDDNDFYNNDPDL